MGAIYKKSDIVGNQYYRPPDFIYKNFDDIAGEDFIIQEGDRLDIIAEQIYNDPNLWTAIALYNNINYFFDLQPGMTIRLPLRIKDITDRM